MTIPNLIHPVSIQIQQVDLSETFQDDDYREPIQQAIYSSTLIVKGQVNWTMKDSLVVHLGGVSVEAAGYVLFRYIDLNTQNITLKINDRLIKLGFVETDNYIIKLQPMGHYQSADGPTLLRAYFADRGAARQRLDL